MSSEILIFEKAYTTLLVIRDISVILFTLFSIYGFLYILSKIKYYVLD